MNAVMRGALAALSLMALAACDQTDDIAAPAGKRAAGEVLGGTISDDMIPLDELRSQSPPLVQVPVDGGSSDASGDEPAAEGDVVSEPAVEPTAETATEPASEADEQ